MATWNTSDRNVAFTKVAGGEKLSDFERRKLAELGSQAGKLGTAARKAVARDEERFGKR